MIRLPTFSAVEAAAGCPGSVSLPRFDEPNEAAAAGTAVHTYLEAVSGGVEPAVAVLLIDEPYRARCSAVPADVLDMARRGAAEVAYAIDTFEGTARELGRNLGRNYGQLAATELAGSLDLVAIDGDRGFVVDAKSGRRQTRARDNWQIRCGVAAVAKAHGVSSVRGSLLYLDEEGGAEVDSHDFDEFAIAETLAELADLHALWLRQAEAPTFTRRGCGSCRSIDVCPSMTALIRSAAGAAQEGYVAIQSGQVGQAVLVWEQLNAAAKALGARLGALASATGEHFDLGDGRMYGLREGREAIADAGVLEAVLVERHGAELAARVVSKVEERHATKGALTKALKGLPNGGETLALARARGALKRSGGAPAIYQAKGEVADGE